MAYDEAAGWRPVKPRAEWTDEEWRAWDESLADEDEPPDEDDEYPDPDDPPLPDQYDFDQIVAESRQASRDRAKAAERAARLGTLGALEAAGAQRRGPGQPGSAQVFPGEYASGAAEFATGMLFDVMPGRPELAGFADQASGPCDTFDGVTDDEVVGLVCAWDRLEAHMAARKHAAIAELIRRRPAPGCAPEGPARMPPDWDEFAVDELAAVLGVSRWDAEWMLGLAHDLAVNLPGTAAALADGIVNLGKADMISRATALLDPDETRAAEALVLDRAGRLTPGGLRSAIARAVMEIAPDKAKKRREEAARKARVERWSETSGNAALAGRELPPAQVLAADQRVSWWARQLREAGLKDSMDELRARAYIDLLLGTDSRPDPHRPSGQDDAAACVVRSGQDGEDGGRGSEYGASRGEDGGGGAPEDCSTDLARIVRGPAHRDSATRAARPRLWPAPLAPEPAAAEPPATAVPPGFAGRVNLTVPLPTLLGLADRPGEILGIGPIDPWLARDLTGAAVRNPKTTWCVTVTDQDGHAIGHGCARPEPKRALRQSAKHDQPDPPVGRDPPDGSRSWDGPGFASTQPGPPGGYGTWRLHVGTQRMLVAVDPIATRECDHRLQARSHDPGVKLRHLTQIRHATCTGPTCRRPAVQADFEHNIPYEAGGRTCLCNGSPKCRHDHRLKQHPLWKVEQVTPATIRWTTPTGRQFTTEPTRYPI